MSLSKYLSIEFVGNYSNISKFFTAKGWEFEIKPVGANKLFLTVSSDLVEEVQFFVGMEIDDITKDRITNIKEITHEEFNNTSENGFEIIHNSNEKNKLIQETPVTSQHNINNEIGNFGTSVEKGFPEYPNLNSVNNERRTVIQNTQQPTTPLEIKDSIASFLSDTVLPSKSPLQNDDPFRYLTSRNYLTNFCLASSVIVFVLALFD